MFGFDPTERVNLLGEQNCCFLGNASPYPAAITPSATRFLISSTAACTAIR